MTDDQKQNKWATYNVTFPNSKKRQVILICIYIYMLVYAKVYLYVQ